MGKRSRSAIAARHSAVSSGPNGVRIASPFSPPLKKRAVGGSDGGQRSRADVTMAPTHANHEMQLSSAIPSVSSSSSSSSPSVKSAEPQRTVREHQRLVDHASWKRRRSGPEGDVSDSTRSSLRHRGEGVASLSAVTTSPAVSGTNRTLVYDTGGASSRGSQNTSDTATTATSPASSSPPPLRRDGVLLTSTPAFLRQRQHQPTAVRNSRDDGESDGAEDGGGRVSTAVAASPVRLMRAAREFLSPARSTLIRGFSHLRQSVLQTPGRPSAPPPPPSSPWGRLSSIRPAREHLPSLSADPPVEGDQRGHAAALNSTFLGLGVSSIPGSRRSSVSASSGVWGGEATRARDQRLTIQRDTEDAVEVSASGSWSSSRLSSPTVRGVDDVAEGTQRCRHRHRHRDHTQHRPYEANGVVQPQLRGSGGAVGAGVALAGPYDARFASVSSLSESLANVVSSSRSTAQSSLTSSAGAAGDTAELRGARPAASDIGAGATSLPRRSATLMDPDFSSILPDEEGRAIRRRMQRHPHGRQQAKPLVQEADPLPRVERAYTNVFELPSVRPPAPQMAANAGRSRRVAAPQMSADSASGSHPTLNRASATRNDSEGHPPLPQQQHPRAFRSSTARSPLSHFAARVTRAMLVVCAVVAALWCVAAAVCPLVALQTSRREVYDVSAASLYAASLAVFLETHVNPVSDLQALYQVPPASLDAEAVARLHRRTLSEGVERLERATQHLSPHENSPPPQRLRYFRAMLHAYVAVQRTSELYARSRDASLWRRLVGYALSDIWTYGIHRFGSFSRDSSSGLGAAGYDWRDRLRTSVACSAQSEFVQCPSLLFVEEAMARAAAPFVHTDVNKVYESPQRRRRRADWQVRLHRDWESEVYLETLLNYLRSSVQELTRDYNR